MKLFYILTVVSILVTSLTAPAKAGWIEPIAVPCWFFRGEEMDLKQTCIYESQSGTGTYTAILTWEDNVRTIMVSGKARNQVSSCMPKNDAFSIDKVCGKEYSRNPKTLKRFSDTVNLREWEDNNNKNIVRCAHANKSKNSVCWIHPYPRSRT
jgi:hypothetical protein